MYNYWDIQQIGHLLLKAAQHALVAQKSLEVKEKGPKKDLYTNGDVEVEQLFAKVFDKPERQEYLIGEETVFSYTQDKELSDVFSHTAYIVDPIDGTWNYLNRVPQWAISVGLVRYGEIVEGAVILPELRELLVSENGAVYYVKFSQDIQHVDNNATIPFELLNPLTHPSESHRLCVLSCESKRRPQKPHAPYHINRSSVYSATKVLMGNYWGYISNAKIWDLAGCIGLFRNMNKTVYYIDGDRLQVLPYAITESHWKDLLSARYDIVFSESEAHAQRFL